MDNTICSKDVEKTDVKTKAIAITRSLNRSYYSNNDSDNRGLIVGSRMKNVALQGVSDVDMYYFTPPDAFRQYQEYTHNGQSAFLQDIKDRLSVTYPQTIMRGDGQVVVVEFNSIKFEIAPAFFRPDDTILIPNTNQGGSWLVATPIQQLLSLNRRDGLHNNYLRPFTRGVKQWAKHCNVPLSSFQLENVIRYFAMTSPYIKNGYYYFDWVFRDFFKYLSSLQEFSVLVAEFENEKIPLGYGWKTRATSAYQRALRACEHERNDEILEAGLEWQKIFGDRINLYV